MRPNRNGGIPPPIPKPRLQLWSPSRVTESVQEIEAAAAMINHVMENLRPCLGTAWMRKAKRFHRNILKFAAMTAKTHRDISAKRSSAAKYPETVYVPAEHISAPRETVTQVKKPAPASRPKTVIDELTKLILLEDEEPQIDLKKPVAKATATPVVAAPRRRMAYIGKL